MGQGDPDGQYQGGVVPGSGNSRMQENYGQGFGPMAFGIRRGPQPHCRPSPPLRAPAPPTVLGLKFRGHIGISPLHMNPNSNKGPRCPPTDFLCPEAAWESTLTRSVSWHLRTNRDY